MTYSNYSTYSTYSYDLSTLARIDVDTYAVTLHCPLFPSIRVYFDVAVDLACLASASIDIAGTLDCWHEAVGGTNDELRLALTAAAKNVPHCWVMDDLDGFTGFYAYIPE